MTSPGEEARGGRRHGGSKAARPGGGWPLLKIPAVPRPRLLLACATVFGVAFLLYLPTLRFDFLSWDDSYYVTQNPWIRAWSYENLRHIFTKPYFVSYMPLQLVSYVADYSVWGLNPFGYHLQQALLHAVDSVLAFIIVRRLLGNFAIAFIAALLFAVHPSHVESVAWVSARKDVLSTAFLFPSLYFYLLARGEKALRWGPYAASVAFFSLAVLSKVNVVVLPLFFLLIDILVVRVTRRGASYWLQALGTKVPYAVIGLWIAVVNWLVEVKTKAQYAHEPMRYLVVKGFATWKYLALLTGIPRQNPIYDTPRLSLDLVTAPLVLAGLIVLPAVSFLGYRARMRTLCLGACWIFIMLLPAIFFPVPTYVADRYLYTPTLGLCWLLAAGIVLLSEKAKAPRGRVAIGAALVLLPVAFFAFRTLGYSKVWANSEALWSHAIGGSQDFRAYNNLARVRMDQNRWDDAERLFKLGSRQTNVTSWEGLTAVYYKTGRYDEALQASAKAFAMHALKGDDPDELAELEYKRGAILWAQSRLEEAIGAWEAAVAANPRHAGARQMLGAARQQASESPPRTTP